jgi:glycosyltransferase involved in cell wall biosynthesis
VQEKSGYILWLPSWYPNRADSFDGDFIKRHAEAAAQVSRIHVIFVTELPNLKSIEEERIITNNLSEHIIYFTNKKGCLGKVWKQLKWSTLLLKAISRFIAENGYPRCIHVQVPWKTGIIALYLKRKIGVPYLLTEHLGIYNKVISENYYSLPTLQRIILRLIFKHSENFVSVSWYLANQVNQIISLKKISIIQNVVDTTLFYYSAEKESTFTFIHVSNMVPLKNVAGLLQAFHYLLYELNVTDIQLVLVGNKNNEYVCLAKKLGLSGKHVQFKGEIPYAAVAGEMRKAHAFVLNSHIENSPCVISEALSCGLPVIATNVGGIPELIEDETDGILVSPNDSIALANAMKRLTNEYQLYDVNSIARKASLNYGYSTAGLKFEKVYSPFR